MKKAILIAVVAGLALTAVAWFAFGSVQSQDKTDAWIQQINAPAPTPSVICHYKIETGFAASGRCGLNEEEVKSLIVEELASRHINVGLNGFDIREIYNNETYNVVACVKMVGGKAKRC